jgi:hypothetical protein
MSVEEKVNRMEKRLIRMEEMLKSALINVQPALSKRITEKDAIKEYGVSQHILRRLRLGYKRSDGMRISPMLFKWGSRNGRSFDYDREELDKVLQRTVITI